MTVPRREVAGLAETAAWVGELGARTALLDVEPLVAGWDTDAVHLRRGVDAAAAAMAAVPGLEVVGFATNSRRRLAGALGPAGAFYLATAGKPLRLRAYRDLPRPGVVVGDQVATDGLLAWRLGFAFAHVRPDGMIPRGPRAMRLLGRPLQGLLFHPG